MIESDELRLRVRVRATVGTFGSCIDCVHDFIGAVVGCPRTEGEGTGLAAQMREAPGYYVLLYYGGPL